MTFNDTVSQIIAWENGDLGTEEEITFFQSLLDSGTIYGLQGMYQRRARQLLEDGSITVSERTD